MPARTNPHETRRANLVSYIDELPRHGEREAYIWREGVRWRTRTYADLHRRVLACAAALAAAGVRPGAPVLIQGPEGADWVEALLGVMKAGAVAVPLDAPTGPGFRNKVARKVESRVFLGPRNIEPPPDTRHIVFGSWGDTLTTPPPDVHPGPTDRAEIIFTSGTTAEPKGVILTHENLVSDLAPIEQAFRKYERYVRLAGRLRLISTLPLSHMFGQVLNVFLALYMGFTILLVAPRPRDVLEAARRKKAWGLFTVPRLLDLLAAEVRRVIREDGRLEEFEERQHRLQSWPFYLQSLAFWQAQRLFGWRFRFFVVGGAPLSEALQRFWERAGYLIVQGYGLTETAPIVSISNPFDRSAGSVGRPLHIQEVRLGTDGEVLVRGPNVTPGYLGSGADVLEDGWFRTGDVGEIDEKGRLRIRGRLKEVIVTPEGENVHPVDVEAAFEGIPGVREVCVIGLPVEGGDRVHAVLLMKGGADPMEAVGRANEKLMPKQRVRGQSVWSDADFPRTSTGKIRKGALRDLIRSREADPAARGGGSQAAGDGVRRIVAQVARVPLDSVAGSTRLMEGLGLGSLDLVELTVALEDEFGASLPEEHLARATVGDLERAVLAVSSKPDPRTAGDDTAPPRRDAGTAPGDRPQPDGAPPSLAGPIIAEGRDGPQMPRWARSAPIHLTRRFLEEILFMPVMRLLARPRVEGLGNLRAAQPPFLLVANHRGYVDSGLFKTMLPRPLRGRIAPGMTTRHHRTFFGEVKGGPARYMKEWFQVRLVQFLFHAWPLPETAGFRASLSYAGELADAGFSLLIFPEGRHAPSGEIGHFRGGIGIFARELRVPVIPAYVEGTAHIFPDDAWWPRFGKTRLVIGAPLFFDPDAEATEITRRIEAAVRDLARE